MPSKTLLYAAEALHFARQGAVFGFQGDSPKADLSAMQHAKKKVIAEFADYQGQIEDGRFELFREHASFLDPHTLALSDGQKAERRKYSSQRVSIACSPDARFGRCCFVQDE